MAGGILALIGMAVLASEQPIITTNRVMAAPQFREVAGQLYNTQLSVKWKRIPGPFDILESPFPDLVLVQSFVMQGIYTVTGTRQGVRNYRRGVAPSVDYREEKVPGWKLFVRNYPFAESKTPYWQLRAMPVGATNYLGSMVDVYDCGTPHYVTVVRTNRIKTPSP